MRKLRLAVVVFTTATALLALTGPASANPKPGPHPGAGIAALSQYPSSGNVFCWGNATPAPQYSGSGGTWGTLHYGGQVICNTTGTLFFRVKLYTVVGSGEHQHMVFQDERTMGPKVDFAIGNSWPVACIGNTSTRWIMSLAATYNGLSFTPSTAWSSVHTLPCGSGD